MPVSKNGVWTSIWRKRLRSLFLRAIVVLVLYAIVSTVIGFVAYRNADTWGLPFESFWSAYKWAAPFILLMVGLFALWKHSYTK